MSGDNQAVLSLELSDGSYRQHSLFAEWLQQHFFPYTLKYGKLTAKHAGCITELVISETKSSVEEKLEDGSNSKLMGVEYALLSLPAALYKFHAPPNSNYNPENASSSIIVPVLKAQIVWELISGKGMWKAPESPNSYVDSTIIAMLVAAKKKELPLFPLKTIDNEREAKGYKIIDRDTKQIGSFDVEGINFELYKATSLYQSLFQNGSYLLASEDYGRVIVYADKQPS